MKKDGEISFCEVKLGFSKRLWGIKNTQLKKVLGKHKKVGILYFIEHKSPKPYNQDSFPLSIIENMKQKGRHGNRNHSLGKRNRGKTYWKWHAERDPYTQCRKDTAKFPWKGIKEGKYHKLQFKGLKNYFNNPTAIKYSLFCQSKRGIVARTVIFHRKLLTAASNHSPLSCVNDNPTQVVFYGFQRSSYNWTLLTTKNLSFAYTRASITAGTEMSTGAFKQTWHRHSREGKSLLTATASAGYQQWSVNPCLQQEVTQHICSRLYRALCSHSECTNACRNGLMPLRLSPSPHQTHYAVFNSCTLPFTAPGHH